MEPIDGSHSPAGGDDTVFGELIQLSYATIADPEKFDTLIDFWERSLGSGFLDEDCDLEQNELVGHFNDALRNFDRMGRVRQEADRAERILASLTVPAVICDNPLNACIKT